MLALDRLEKRQELLEEGTEQSRAAKTNLRQRLTVHLHNLLNALNLRELRVSIHGKAVIDTIDSKMARDATKSEDWEKLV